MTEVAIWSLSGKDRSQKIATALGLGASAAGYKALIRMDNYYRQPIGDIAAFYGYQKSFPRIMAEYIAAGKTVVFVDLGYWGRRLGGRYKGYHKVTINGRNPDKYLMKRNRDANRITLLGIKALPWRSDGNFIIVAGMSDKSANSYGLKPEEWERWAVAELQKHTIRPIIYRPKPSWLAAKPIPGSHFQPAQKSSDATAKTFAGCHAVVTHHSNIAIDALVNGVPSFCWDGAATCMSLQDLSKIEKPLRPPARDQWLANIAWCQWSVPEIASGAMWRSLKMDKFIP